MDDEIVIITSKLLFLGDLIKSGFNTNTNVLQFFLKCITQYFVMSFYESVFTSHRICISHS